MTVPLPRRIATTADALASACSLRFPSPRQKETAMSAPEPSEITVEKVARAIFEADHHTHGGMAWDSDDFTDWERDVYRRLATVAIAAMQPSPAARADETTAAVGIAPAQSGDVLDGLWGR